MDGLGRGFCFSVRSPERLCDGIDSMTCSVAVERRRVGVV